MYGELDTIAEGWKASDFKYDFFETSLSSFLFVDYNEII